jgi:hypothetical protein
MCYLKNVKNEETMEFDEIYGKVEEETQKTTSEEDSDSVLLPSGQQCGGGSCSGEQQMLAGIMERVLRNSCLILGMQKVHECVHVDPTESFRNSREQFHLNSKGAPSMRGRARVTAQNGGVSLVVAL